MKRNRLGGTGVPTINSLFRKKGKKGGGDKGKKCGGEVIMGKE